MVICLLWPTKHILHSTHTVDSFTACYKWGRFPEVRSWAYLEIYPWWTKVTILNNFSIVQLIFTVQIKQRVESHSFYEKWGKMKRILTHWPQLLTYFQSSLFPSFSAPRVLSVSLSLSTVALFTGTVVTWKACKYSQEVFEGNEGGRKTTWLHQRVAVCNKQGGWGRVTHWLMILCGILSSDTLRGVIKTVCVCYTALQQLFLQMKKGFCNSSSLNK